LLKSLEAERQLTDVLARPHIAAVTIPGYRTELAGLIGRAELVQITERIAACRDPTDDKFLELAVNGRADLIISGDRDLLALDPFRSIPIITPAAFMRDLAS
jgi:predicted nucleic acid-binding protein